MRRCFHPLFLTIDAMAASVTPNCLLKDVMLSPAENLGGYLRTWIFFQLRFAIVFSWARSALALLYTISNVI